MSSRNGNNVIVVATGIGALAPILSFFVGGILSSFLSTAFGLTWLYCIVHAATDKKLESSSKVGWIAGVILFSVLIVPFYWWFQIRGSNKWSQLAGSM